MRAGSSQRSSGGSLIGMDKFILHPDFDDWTLEYDSSVIHSVADFTGKNIVPIQVIAVNQPIPAGTMATVSGWGLTVRMCF
jgi:trypsin